MTAHGTGAVSGGAPRTKGTRTEADDGRMENRRNYYRILRVQPDAPLEVIKSSYRTLMTKLGLTPTWAAITPKPSSSTRRMRF